MAGHSHWAGIKHKKAAADKKRGKIFSKLAKAIIVMAKTGGGDPDQNIQLRAAVDAAKAANMPKENIERAIKRGSGELEGVTYSEILYEGVGPKGVSIMADALTDNKNRTVAEIRKVFENSGGNLGSSVAWNFSKMGFFLIAKTETLDEESLTEIAIEGGAEDVQTLSDDFEILTAPEDFEEMKKTLDSAKIKWQTAEITLVPKNKVTLENKNDLKKVINLLENLDDHDDIQRVYCNCEFPENMEFE